jgi:hypothetical protein
MCVLFLQLLSGFTCGQCQDVETASRERINLMEAAADSGQGKQPAYGGSSSGQLARATATIIASPSEYVRSVS